MASEWTLSSPCANSSGVRQPAGQALRRRNHDRSTMILKSPSEELRSRRRSLIDRKNNKGASSRKKLASHCVADGAGGRNGRECVSGSVFSSRSKESP